MFFQDLHDKELVASAQRFEAKRREIESALEKAQRGDVDKVEPQERIRKYWKREREHWSSGEQSGVRSFQYPELGMERVLGMSNDLLSIEFLEAGLLAAGAVGMTTVAGSDSGTGFLVGNGLLLTNHHVIDSADTAEMSVLNLDYEANRIGKPKPVETFYFDPGRFFITDPDHDFTLVALKPTSLNDRPVADFGYHPIIAAEGKILIGRPVSIIQHPKGRLKSLVVHDSRFMYVENGGDLDRYCWYTSDTEPGSSGSPVFNNRWEVVALHHKSIPKRNSRGQVLDRNNRVMSKERAENNPEDIAWVANEGIRASRLVRAIEAMEIPAAFEDERRALLALWTKPRTQAVGLESRRRLPEELPPQRTAPAPGAAPDTDSVSEDGAASGITVAGQPSLPVTITIRIGDG